MRIVFLETEVQEVLARGVGVPQFSARTVVTSAPLQHSSAREGGCIAWPQAPSEK